TAAAVPAAGSGDQDLLKQLQSLPEDGNLLPFLQQVIDAAATAGTNPRKLLESIVAGLHGTGTDAGRQVAARIQEVLDQLVEGGAVQTAAVPADTAALAAGYRDITGTQEGSPVAPGRRLPQLLEQLRLSHGGAGEHGKPPAEGGRGEQGSGVAKFLEPLYQPKAETGQRSLELLTVLAGLRQPGGGLKPAVQGVAAGPETLSAAISHTALQPAGPAGSSAIPSVSVDVPVQQANWDQALGERIQWLMGQRLQGAQIKLNPAHLGPMEVRIQVQHDQASIQFSSAHAVVREALEAALPRLRDMFESAGVELLNVDVSGQSLAHQQGAPEGREASTWKRLASGPDEGVETVLETPVGNLEISGRLDLFA
ncbi:MAG: flagellar hook-length control protein FliK, partial [Gammaproteobacteria bacterium]